MSGICVIFDLDGTLVDSETLCNQAFIDLLPELDVAVETLVARYRGKKLALILADLESRLSRPLTSDFEIRYRARVAELFARSLRPTSGSQEMLSVIPHPFCLASSGPLTKIKQALQVSGLEPFFGSRVFCFSFERWALSLQSLHILNFLSSTSFIQLAFEQYLSSVFFSMASALRFCAR